MAFSLYIEIAAVTKSVWEVQYFGTDRTGPYVHDPARPVQTYPDLCTYRPVQKYRDQYRSTGRSGPLVLYVQRSVRTVQTYCDRTGPVQTYWEVAVPRYRLERTRCTYDLRTYTVTVHDQYRSTWTSRCTYGSVQTYWEVQYQSTTTLYVRTSTDVLGPRPKVSYYRGKYGRTDVIGRPGVDIGRSAQPDLLGRPRPSGYSRCGSVGRP